jgi:DNA invertase Pin-like site-specific DNA recombinase
MALANKNGNGPIVMLYKVRPIQVRTRAGLAAARARGRKGGRRPLPADTLRVVLAGKLFQDRTVNIKQICETLHVSRTTLTATSS